MVIINQATIGGGSHISSGGGCSYKMKCVTEGSKTICECISRPLTILDVILGIFLLIILLWVFYLCYKIWSENKNGK